MASRPPRGADVCEKWLEATSLEFCSQWKSAKIDQRRVEIEKTHRLRAALRGFRHAGSDDEKRNPCRFFPQRELPPVLLLAEVPPVIAPEDNDRVLPVRAGVESRN